MARKDPKIAADHRGLNDIIGIVLLAGALLLMLAQVSFDRYDIDANKLPPNQPAHNWIGGAGAWGANVLFYLFGAGAFVLPMLLLAFGWVTSSSSCPLKRRWLWAGVLFVFTSGSSIFTRRNRKRSHQHQCLERGRCVSQFANDLIFRHFGRLARRSFCLLRDRLLSDEFHLSAWLRSWFLTGRNSKGQTRWKGLVSDERRWPGAPAIWTSRRKSGPTRQQ
jgi:DNA segregation ATPase FtsK/SpoIIIE-like protein